MPLHPPATQPEAESFGPACDWIESRAGRTLRGLEEQEQRCSEFDWGEKPQLATMVLRNQTPGRTSDVWCALNPNPFAFRRPRLCGWPSGGPRGGRHWWTGDVAVGFLTLSGAKSCRPPRCRSGHGAPQILLTVGRVWCLGTPLFGKVQLGGSPTRHRTPPVRHDALSLRSRPWGCCCAVETPNLGGSGPIPKDPDRSRKIRTGPPPPPGPRRLARRPRTPPRPTRSAGPAGLT